MDGSVSPKLVSQPKPTETRASKRRKLVEKMVATVKVGEYGGGKLKNEGPPSDLWSWRKYGQKPIKGSPYPRGYYRCSASKGCSAKKRVERCKTDASLLIITYTSTHNHPGPDHLDSTDTKLSVKEPKINHSDDGDGDDDDKPSTPKQEQPVSEQNEPYKASSDEEASEEPHFHYLQSPLRFPQSAFISQEDTLGLGFLLDEEESLFSCPRITISSTQAKSEENDFFDELEELPICSAFTRFMRSNKFFDEGLIPVFPS